MITYNWLVSEMKTKPSSDGLTNVVESCRWGVTGVDSQNPTIKFSEFGNTHFDSPNSQEFTAYNDLTEQQVLEWVWSAPEKKGGVDKTKIEKIVSEQIELQKNPPSVVLSNPWDKPEYETPSE